MLRVLTSTSLALCLAVTPAGAQFFQFPFGQPQYSPPPPQQQQQSPRPRPSTPPGSSSNVRVAPQPDAPAPVAATPYDPELLRLSEILGSLHFLRGICGANEGQKWRNQAQTLIEAEAPTGERHDKMVQSFNRGYLSFQQSYRTCTPAATIAIRRYLEEGARIARDITARYTN